MTQQRRQHYYSDQVAELYTSDGKKGGSWLGKVRSTLPAPFGRVLDVGCGDGSSSLGLTDQADLLVGVDVSLPMLRLGQKRLQADGITNAVFVLADMTRLPFKAGAFNAVISTAALHHTRLDQSLPSIRRVLRGGGTLLINDILAEAAWVRTPAGYVVNHLLQFPGRVRRRGLKKALRHIRLRLHPDWMADYFSDFKLPAEEHQAQYRRHLPGCQIEITKHSALAKWQAPASE
jgi:ubiquinone/menaquinone biosynthesis C-methylase UbiE